MSAEPDQDTPPAGGAEKQPPSGREPDIAGARPAWLKLIWPTWEERKRMLRKQAWIAVGAGYLLMVFAYAAPQDFRAQSHFWLVLGWAAFMVRVLLFHAGLLFAAIAGVAALRRSWRLLAAAAPLVLFTLGPELWEFRPRSRPAASPAGRVMSVNLLMINKATGPMAEEIAASGADLVLLQEYTAGWHRALRAALAKEYPYAVAFTREDSFGAAVYSRQPFEADSSGPLNLGRCGVPQIRVVTSLGGRRVAVYNVHLLPPRRLDYTREHRQQFADLLDRLADERLPLVLAGDFNFTPRTPEAARLRKLGLADAHARGGWGRGTTWPVNSWLGWLPGVRLDQIWTSSDLACARCRTGRGPGSDHRPVVADFAAATGAPR